MPMTAQCRERFLCREQKGRVAVRNFVRNHVLAADVQLCVMLKLSHKLQREHRQNRKTSSGLAHKQSL